MSLSTVHPTSVTKNPQSSRTYSSYTDIARYLDAAWNVPLDPSGARMAQLDTALGNPSKKVSPLFVAGTNGKELFCHFTTRLLVEEKYTVGTLTGPHIQKYTERISCNGTHLTDAQFTELFSEVIARAHDKKITAHAQELITAAALYYFVQTGVNATILELSKPYEYDPATICTPKIVALMRVTAENVEVTHRATPESIAPLMSLVKPKTAVICADPSKLNLSIVQAAVIAAGGQWLMPIRKAAPLAYPFEQLHGRYAALAERVVHTYITQTEGATHKDPTSLLTKPRAHRGRPTLEAKKQAELNPEKTIEQFWRTVHTNVPGQFQLLNTEHPAIVLDTASNIESLKQLLLGVRLIHYRTPLKGLSIVMGFDGNDYNTTELVKTIRYFFKKTMGQLFLCPVEAVPGVTVSPEKCVLQLQQLTTECTSAKIKVRLCSSFADALQNAQESVDERHGLVVITGSGAVVHNYWQLKK